MQHNEERETRMQSDNLFTPMLTAREVARLLNIHQNTVRRWSTRGIIPALRIGPRGDQRFFQEDIAHIASELHRNNGDERKLRST
jgi:excisionase family DNA binding protein